MQLSNINVKCKTKSSTADLQKQDFLLRLSIILDNWKPEKNNNFLFYSKMLNVKYKLGVCTGYPGSVCKLVL